MGELKSDKMPPNSPEIEKDVLSVMSHRPDMIVSIEDIITPECFYNSDNQYLYGVIMEIHLSGQPVSQSAILQKIIPGGRSDILALYQKMRNYYSSESALYQNVMLLFEMAKRRALLIQSFKTISMIEGNEEIEEIEKVLTDSVEIVTSGARKVEGVSFKESLDELEGLMDKPMNKGISGITTGLKTLDGITGGWQFDDTVVIAARPGMGKTIAAAFHAYKAAKAGIPVAFITLEVSKAKITGRIMSNLCGFNSSDITKGRLARNQKEHLRAVRKTVEDLPIYYYDNSNSWDINDICRTMRNWKRKYNIGLIVIDYLQLIRDRTVKDSSDLTRVLNSTVPKLTQLRSTLQIPFIQLSQLNRESETRADKRPGLQNLKNSGKIEEDATVIIFLFRQDYYDANAAMEKGLEFVPSYDMEYIFAKNREGELGPAPVKCNPGLNRIYDVDETTFTDFDEQKFQHARNTVFQGVQTSFN